MDKDSACQFRLDRFSHGQKSLAGYSSWGHKESDMSEVTQHACTPIQKVQERQV